MSDTGTKDDTFGFDKFHESLGFANGITNPFSVHRAFRFLKKILLPEAVPGLKLLERGFTVQTSGTLKAVVIAGIVAMVRLFGRFKIVEAKGKISSAVELERSPDLVIDQKQKNQK